MTTPIAVTIPEAVKLSGLSRTHFYEAFKCGQISARKAGRRTIILLDDLEDYLVGLPRFPENALEAHLVRNATQAEDAN
jgi:hypothetical protein